MVMNWFYNSINWLTRTVGRFLFAIPFAVFGIMHFIYTDDMVPLVPVPGGIVWVWVTGIVLIAAALSIIIGVRDKLAAFLLGVFMLITAFFSHFPMVAEANALGDSAAAGAAMSHVLKDLMLAGASWMYAGSVGARDKFEKIKKANPKQDPVEPSAEKSKK